MILKILYLDLKKPHRAIILVFIDFQKKRSWHIQALKVLQTRPMLPQVFVLIFIPTQVVYPLIIK